MRFSLKALVLIVSIGFSMGIFTLVHASNLETSQESVSTGSMFIVLGTNTSTTTSDLNSENEDTSLKQETEEERKDKEKTINDINTFLIESYKLKIDRILANLNISIERITNNDTTAQARLLEKIRGDVSSKIEVINSRSISENRKKILSSIFSYIQENLDAKISKLVRQK
ncbi:hypothetical protein GW819_00310 [Candidatus Gracilibacteria bacterium]|nr:hypothetical protein [bacterium]NDK19267.1 hypothetical protein [Candidatus Gracilibacteria bacterium]PIQ10772.1 MAG: hypothetical protein COW68_03795 [Candidatus Gracilibacteria bacterium CG18_big_fil_WC_8_21_14_2_50_38_16]PIQ42044.1 MAG: hypothetical protein COW06_00870 [Candidatus Gracilibacteria bacterium CG12_big_fil_rev_8_21_14_0_65_38_15]PIZ01900.1 MAG: hypothetical protein COY60_01255 [Candidatus Gracilibacteria bacterium CG_4_10_14_0_8_um_filter_38_28]PJC56741.1 MAG: hypothetical p